MILMATVFLTLISLFQAYKLWQKKRYKEIVIYLLFTIVNLTYATLIYLDYNPVTTEDLIEWMGDHLF